MHAYAKQISEYIPQASHAHTIKLSAAVFRYVVHRPPLPKAHNVTRITYQCKNFLAQPAIRLIASLVLIHCTLEPERDFTGHMT